jgi:hypothetical protein
VAKPLYVHGGVKMQLYKKGFKKYCKPITYIETYLVSEGISCLPKRPNADGMQLSIRQ